MQNPVSHSYGKKGGEEGWPCPPRRTVSIRRLRGLMEIRYLCGGLNYWAERSRMTGTWEPSSTWASYEQAGVRCKTFMLLFSKQMLEIFAIMTEGMAFGFWTAPWAPSPHPTLMLPGMLRRRWLRSPKTKPYVTMHVISPGKTTLITKYATLCQTF